MPSTERARFTLSATPAGKRPFGLGPTFYYRLKSINHVSLTWTVGRRATNIPGAFQRDNYATIFISTGWRRKRPKPLGGVLAQHIRQELGIADSDAKRPNSFRQVIRFSFQLWLSGVSESRRSGGSYLSCSIRLDRCFRCRRIPA